MRVRNHYRLAVALIAASLIGAHSAAQAAAVPSYTGRLNAAVGGVLTSKLGRWGFAASDPKVKATLNAVGAKVAGVVGLAAGGYIAYKKWPETALEMGISYLTSGNLPLDIDGIINWAWGDSSNPGKVEVSGSGMNSMPIYSNGIQNGSYAWQTSSGGWWGSPQEALSYYFSLILKNYPTATFGSISFTADSATQYTAHYTYSIPPLGQTNVGATKVISRVTYTGSVPCANGMGYVSGAACTSAGLTLAGNGLGGTVYTPSWVAPDQATTDLPESELTRGLSNEQLAALINALWQATGASVPNTVPRSGVDPLTAADVAAWIAAHPQARPTVGDFVGPVAPPNSPTVPIPSTDIPTSSTTITETTAPSTSTKVDLGPDPNVAAPTLEDTPTADMILAPVFGMMPELRAWTVPAHQAVCPKASFTLYWESSPTVIDAHCALMDQLSGQMQQYMGVVWLVAALFIVLRA